MCAKKSLFFTIMLLFVVAGTFTTLDAAPTQAYKMSFDEAAAGTLPRNWKIDATNPMGKFAEWEVATDKNATSKPNVLSITRIHDTSNDVFNLCWTRGIAFQDGVIEINIRANTGKEDQGGGVIWRAQDVNNYYVARYNPLEKTSVFITSRTAAASNLPASVVCASRRVIGSRSRSFRKATRLKAI
ncbi:MAG: hypothetical protein ABFS02_03210 [Pseudomonadota bacterium]